MNSNLSIGDFSRATHLSAKMLRHYYEIGLLKPVDVDVNSGYRAQRRRADRHGADYA
jgi:DNA-binding transcriptional MerR regulator